MEERSHRRRRADALGLVVESALSGGLGSADRFRWWFHVDAAVLADPGQVAPFRRSEICVRDGPLAAPFRKVKELVDEVMRDTPGGSRQRRVGGCGSHCLGWARSRQ